jgi:NSS family neurotransmitter:Na+ symporter
MGFVLAAAGSAIGLGNIWRFPWLTGEHGGGLFVLIYLACVAVVGLPIMIAEILIGRTAQLSPVGAFRALSRPASPWLGLGWLSVVAAFIILSYYSVVAGWAMHYLWLSLTDTFAGRSPEQIGATFGALATSEELSTLWHLVFMGVTVGIVAGGVKGGIERWSCILMPGLFLIMAILLVYAMTTGSFGEGLAFIFAPDPSEFSWHTVLAALGQAFFSLSLGMGAMITYGSYLRREDDIVTTSATVCALDTAAALLAAMIFFPILFAAGQHSDQGPGLVFTTLPIAFSQMPGGTVLAPAFFLLLVFAALTSTISLLEVASAYFIDERGWSRARAALVTGGSITVLGIPSAMSAGSALFGTGVKDLTAPLFGTADAKSWFDLFDYVATNWMLPFGGLGIAAFAAWRVGDAARRESFGAGTRLGALYWGWVQLLRYVVPLAVGLVFLNALGVFG